MTDIGWADLEVRPDVSTFGSQLGRGINGPLDSVGRSSGKRFGSVLGKAALGVAGGVLAAGYAAISIGKDAYAEAKEARKVAALTEQTIKSTGRAANISAAGVSRLSESIMEKTAIDDEAIQSGANMLLTFKNVRNEVGKGNKIFNEATQAAVDLGSTGFTSLEGGAKMLGKALNDPAAGLTALKKAGVDFTAKQKERIAGFVEENNILGAQKIILSEVQSQVGGAAAAQADAGDKLGVVIGNIKEDIGTALMPTIDRFADWMSNKGPAAGRKFSGWLSDEAIPAIGNFVAETRPLAQELLPAVGDALGTVKDVLADALPIAKDFVSAFNDMPDWAKKAIIGGALAGGAASKLGLLGGGSKGGLGGLISSAKPVPVFVTNGSALGLGGPDVGGGKGGKSSGFLAGAAKTVLPYYLGYEADKNFPDQMPYGGWLPGASEDSDPRLKLGGWQVMLDDLFGGGEKAVHDFGDAIEDTIPLTQLLGGSVDTTVQSVSFLSERFKALPDKVETAIKTPGLIDTQADVMDLKRKFDLTPREVKTVLKSLGFDEAKNKAEAAKRAMDLLRDKTVTVTTVYTTRNSAKEERDQEASGGFGREAVPGRGRQAVVINLPNGAPLDGYIDDRYHANRGLGG